MGGRVEQRQGRGEEEQSKEREDMPVEWTIIEEGGRWAKSRMRSWTGLEPRTGWAGVAVVDGGGNRGRGRHRRHRISDPLDLLSP